MTPFLLLFVALTAASPAIKIRQTSYQEMDRNRDGRLEQLEVYYAMTLDQAMLALDHDGDGYFGPIQIYQLTSDPTLFQQLDTNADGKVSFDEVRAGTNIVRIFDREDTDGDGYLDGPEADRIVFIYVEMKIHGLENWAIDLMDTDQDQRLSKQEVKDAITMDQIFAAADLDEDGAFTLTQMQTALMDAAQQINQLLNANGDDYLSFAECRALLDMGRFFDLLDYDDSGYLEGAEANQAANKYKLIRNRAMGWQTDPTLDTDGDKKLSQAEVANAMTEEQIMAATDENGDGQFSAMEILQYYELPTLQMLDTDGDGTVSMAEMRAVFTMDWFFNYSDADGSGFLENLEQFRVRDLYRKQAGNDVGTKRLVQGS